MLREEVVMLCVANRNTHRVAVETLDEQISPFHVLLPTTAPINSCSTYLSLWTKRQKLSILIMKLWGGIAGWDGDMHVCVCFGSRVIKWLVITIHCKWMVFIGCFFDVYYLSINIESVGNWKGRVSLRGCASLENLLVRKKRSGLMKDHGCCHVLAWRSSCGTCYMPVKPDLCSRTHNKREIFLSYNLFLFGGETIKHYLSCLLISAL